MNINTCLFFYLVIIFGLKAHSQIEKVDHKDLKKRMLRKYLREHYPKTEGYYYNGNEVHSKEYQDMTLGSISISLFKESLGDFNKDSIKDMWAEIFDSGMGGGGNMFCKRLGVVQVDNKDSLSFTQAFFTSKISDVNYEFQGMEDGNPIIYAETGWQGSLVDLINKTKEVVIDLNIKRQTLVQVSDKEDCDMDNMTNKSIFKDHISVTRKEGINDFLEKEYVERHTINSRVYEGVLSGCNGLFLEIFMQVPEQNNRDEKDLQNELYKFAIENTRFKTIFRKIRKHHNENNLKNDYYGRYINTYDGWLYKIGSHKKHGKTVVFIKYYSE